MLFRFARSVASGPLPFWRPLGAASRGPVSWSDSFPGISTKVLTERLRKLLDYELVTRFEFPGKVQRVEYQLTETGRKLAGLLEQPRDLDEEHARRDSGRSDPI